MCRLKDRRSPLIYQRELSLFALLWLVALPGCGGRPRAGVGTRVSGTPVRLVNETPACGITYQYPALARPLGTKEAFGCGCAFLDYDGDGFQDVLLVAAPHAWLYRNLGNGHFEDVTQAVGLDKIELDKIEGDWRGCAVGDYDGDGRMDLVVTNFSGKGFQLYHGLGRGAFEHQENAVGLAAPTFQSLGFGAKWADVDNDGWPDVLFASGHVYDDPGQIDHFSKFRQPLMLFHNEGGKHFTDLAPKIGGDLARPILGRGLAVGDYDNDGQVDFLVVDYEGRPLLLHNRTQTSNHWITFDLRGHAPNVFAYGAHLTARAGGKVWAGFVSPASSYLSSSDPRLHFGLGPVKTLESVEIAWPDGRGQVLRAVPADRILRVEEE